MKKSLCLNYFSLDLHACKSGFLPWKTLVHQVLSSRISTSNMLWNLMTCAAVFGHLTIRSSNKLWETGVAFSLAWYFSTPTRANVNTCLIPVHPLACIVHAKWCTEQPRDIHKLVLCVYTLCVPQNDDASECYTGLKATVCVVLSSFVHRRHCQMGKNSARLLVALFSSHLF